MEFFVNLWNGIVAHKDEIIVTVTSSQFITFIFTLIFSMKNKKSTQANTESNAALSSQLSTITQQLATIAKMQSDIANMQKSIAIIQDENVKTKESIELIMTKLNAQMDAQTQVWSTIKDEELRTTVTNILTNAKYLETGNVVEMRKQLEDLQQRLNAQTQEINKDIATTVEKVQKVVKTSNNIQRV